MYSQPVSCSIPVSTASVYIMHSQCLFYSDCACVMTFSVCALREKSVWPWRKWKPLQIMLNPESSCLTVEFTSRHCLHGKWNCRWSNRKLPSRLTLASQLLVSPKYFFVLLLVSHTLTCWLILVLYLSKSCEAIHFYLQPLWPIKEHFYHWETQCLQQENEFISGSSLL